MEHADGATILVVDDEPHIRSHLADCLGAWGHQVETASGVADARAAFAARNFDLVLSDVRMAGADGLVLLREARRLQPDAIVVLMTAYASVANAVEAIRAGAYDYLVKPFSPQQLQIAVQRALEVRELRRENDTMRLALGAAPLLKSSSPTMQRAIDMARHASASDAAVLLTGESGTGKNVLAAAIHGWSPRGDGPFVTVPCVTLTEHFLESELFGHVRGAFSGAWKDTRGRFEIAAGGTLFFDEVGDLSPELQAKLLRFLDERRFERVGSTETIEVDARVIAATNKNLDEQVRAGRFREDLFFRLNVVAISLPPLRERAEDLGSLTDHLIERLAARYHRGRLGLTADARRLIASYRWPGNVRELANVLERAVVLSREDVIGCDEFPDRMFAPAPITNDARLPHGLSLEEMERREIEIALLECPTLEEAASRLGINPATLWRKRKRYGFK